jgi:Aspartyl protease
LPVGIRRNGVIVGTDLVLMVDTGADTTLLHLRWARLMGFQDADLLEENCTSASGKMTVYRPRIHQGIEFEIGNTWFSVPSLQFGKDVPISLLGRDAIFTHFNLKMTARDFELLPLPRKNRKK